MLALRRSGAANQKRVAENQCRDRNRNKEWYRDQYCDHDGDPERTQNRNLITWGESRMRRTGIAGSMERTAHHLPRRQWRMD
ncbi:hypothetical protein EVAR_28940_1 [Eumeta japonica]|uniref:Uncharacterized protein n=1 Tax=Eumeta variegata TaxID=151549 RepID=A0A4C1W136_EUMVA|nr:hypothetical protein EVAR_28940_1 [Eumeta japonica]